VPNPSIVLIPTARADLFAFEVKGRVHQSDIEWMARTLQSAFDRLGTVDVIIVMKDWKGIDLSAAFDPQSLWTQASANAHIRRYAVVGAPGWAKSMINILSPLTPVKEKTFDLPEEAEAWLWIDRPS
jgi:hypothetical protein